MSHEPFKSNEELPAPGTPLWRRIDLWGLIAGPLFLVLWLTLKPGVWESPADRLLGVWILTVLWWITEPIPISVTGLFAICLALLLGIPEQVADQAGRDIAKINFTKETLAPFADPSVYFLMGGMFLGLAMSRHGLDRRFALGVLCTGHGKFSRPRVIGDRRGRGVDFDVHLEHGGHGDRLSDRVARLGVARRRTR
ncbi:MAG: anion permease [Pirellulales bacterium]